MALTAGLYYHPEAYATRGPLLMGRNVAGESFLRGWLRYGSHARHCIQVDDPAHLARFADQAHAFGCQREVLPVTRANLQQLAQAGTVFHPGPGLAKPAWQRAAHGHSSWSLCGITHTICSAGAMDAVVDLVTAPVQPWDALICTSAAVRQSVQNLLQQQVAYLQERLGSTRTVLPECPVIPLGVHADDFALAAASREQQRATLGIAADTLVVLFMGRLSFHAKAHPLAMYQALELAAQRTGKQVLLVECGQHATASIARAYADAARQACPSVRTLTLDGGSPEQRRTALAIADVACSLADNIQESFGIVPVEAMAAGLPLVVSDWDGYKDTVRDGVDGFRVATLMPAAGMGGDLAYRHALGIDNYDKYSGYVCAFVAVDVGATAAAFERLFASAALRRSMGESGRRRVAEHYDWRVIIPQYEQLWQQLAEIRRAAAARQSGPVPGPWPARADPWQTFANYATATLAPDTLLALTTRDPAAALALLRQHRRLAMVTYADAVLPTDDELATVLAAADTRGKPACQLVEGIEESRRVLVFRALCWLVKLHVLGVVYGG